MSYNLFLDDNFTPTEIANLETVDAHRKRYRNLDWIVVRNYVDFVDTINQKGLPDIISFDHDLAPEHYEQVLSDDNWQMSDNDIVINYNSFKIETGYHAAKWLLAYCDWHKLELPFCMIHSQNKIGKRNLINILF